MSYPLTRQRYSIRTLQPARLLLVLITIASLGFLPFLVRGRARAKSHNQPSGHPAARLARLSESISVQAAGRGNPSLNLSDGHDLITQYVGPEESRVALEQDQAEPLSLASADFDEDGVPDLVSGYAYKRKGIVTLLRGNVDAIYPNAPEAQQRKADGTFTDAPFLSPAGVFANPVAADFIGAGDFDGDSHWDVVTASKTRRSLFLFSGDGHGAFAATQEIALPGTVTALTTGEINRADGLTDVVVGVNGQDGSMVMVFEGPEGALKAQPEVFAMPATVTALALGQSDSSYEIDLAIGAGDELVLVHGRDRKLSLHSEQQQKISPAQVEQRVFPYAIALLTIGDFANNHQPAVVLMGDDGRVEVIAPNDQPSKAQSLQQLSSWQERTVTSGLSADAGTLLRTKISSASGDDLLVLDQSQVIVLSHVGQAEMTTTNLEVSTAPVAALPMRLNSDAFDDVVVLKAGASAPAVVSTTAAQTFTVNTTSDADDGACDAAHCSLREAINAANNNPGADSITFNIPGAGVKTITPLASLPEINSPVTIDGYTQPGTSLNTLGDGNNAHLLIELSGASAGAFNVLYITAGSSTVRGLVMNRSGVHGISLETNGNNVIEGNFIGTDVTGTFALGNHFHGVMIRSSNNTVGGTVPGARNVISGNELHGAVIDNRDGLIVGGVTGNQIQGNFIGVTATGTAALPNQDGVDINEASNNTVGGTTAGARNVISGNRTGGVLILHSTAAGNQVRGNFIGADVTGATALSNNGGNVFINGAPGNSVGGTTAAARNVISGSAYGVLIGGQVALNFQPGSGPITGTDNQVQGNYIGTDATGAAALGNQSEGVVISNSNRNTIGGTIVGARNVISGNGLTGISLYGGPNEAGPGESKENKIQGNFIGTNAAGTAKLSNGGDGLRITIANSAAENTIGGATPDARNVVSGNNGNGISIGIRLRDPVTGQPLPGTGGTGIMVQNNYIGIDVTGQNCIGNTLNGIFVDADSAINTIRDNLIACNGRNGVFIPQNSNPGVRIFIDNNSVFANAALGIDLGNAGITPNDPLDTDTGANLQQNFPVLTTFTGNAPDDDSLPKPDSPDAAINVNATLNSTPNTTFTVHWYFSSDAQCNTNQQTSRPLVTGKVPGVITDGNGNASFNFPFDFPAGLDSGIINSTATDPVGNTSEFSGCLPVNSSPPPTVKLSNSSYNLNEGLGSASVTVVRTGEASAAAAVNYATSDTAGSNSCNVLNSGVANSRCDYEATAGTLRFAAGETSKTILIPVIDDVYAEGNESFTVTLSNAAGALLGPPSVATVIINDNETVTGANPINNANFFVRLHYIDFFTREPDAGGLAFWSDQITSCGTDQACVDLRRINVSAAFYLSIEFQDTGYLVYRFYKAAYGNIPNGPVPVRFNEFLPDTQQIGQGLIVGQTGWEQVLENNKVAFATDFVTRSRFTSAYATTLTPTQFVDALFVNGVVTPSSTDRTAAINEFGGAGNTSDTAARGRALRRVAENAILKQQETNKAFVLMQYFGYLRRNPYDPPEAGLDFGGFNFWLGKLNQFNGNFVNAEMVKAFIVSGEYQQRFGP